MKKQDLVPYVLPCPCSSLTGRRHPNPNRGSRRGAIVSISSIAGTRALPNGAAYVSSKHAVIGLTKTAALENGHLGIRVYVEHDKRHTDGWQQLHLARSRHHTCASHVTWTPCWLTSQLTQEEDNLAPGFMQTALDRTPLGRGGAPEDIGDVIVFLCSDQAAFVSGSNWGVDGAMLS
jgi:NAD(P)-dependent dehydrogenase (short-subunit alcohol dehydrogenase family)